MLTVLDGLAEFERELTPYINGRRSSSGLRSALGRPISPDPMRVAGNHQQLAAAQITGSVGSEPSSKAGRSNPSLAENIVRNSLSPVRNVTGTPLRAGVF